MSRWAVVLAAILATVDASADVEVECAMVACASEPAGDLGAVLHTRTGAARAPFFTRALNTAESEFTQARLVVVGAHLRVRGWWRIGLRVPSAPSTIRQPAGSYVDDKALGNPELFVDGALGRLSIPRGELRFTHRLGLAAPLAFSGGGSSLIRNRALAVADALDGWRNPELYAPGVLPVTMAVAAHLRRGRSYGWARAKLPLLVRVHDADLPAESNRRPLGIVPSFEVRAGTRPLRWWAIDFGLHTSALVLAPVEVAATSSRQDTVHLGLEPRMSFFVTSRAVLAADVSWAVRGPLVDTYGIGLSFGYHR